MVAVSAHIRPQRRSRLSVVLLILLLLVPASPHASDVVLCVERSGQLNVEKASFGECADAPGLSDDRRHDLGNAVEDEHCVDCADVPLRFGEADDPCGTAILPSPISLDGPTEALSVSALELGHEPSRVEDGSAVAESTIPRSLRRLPGREVSLGSVVLLI